MDPSRFARLKREFQALREADGTRRAEGLARLSIEDRAFAAELAAWLRAEGEGAGEWLEQPAVLALEQEADGALASDPAPPERVGPWRIEAEIGRGGMGSVFRGRRDDGAFEQTVAIKLVRSELASEILRRRFLAERRILARLVHPNIAHVIDGGTTTDGVPYLVLEHVAGEPIDRWCDRQALSLAARLRLFVAVCGAVEFAHQSLVLHRDLKAANVLVDRTGQPKLLDFGIATLLAGAAEDEEWTALGLPRPLTPEWASPEQLRNEPLTTASDVYSLGVLLHVLLTGRRPHRFTGQSPADFAQLIATTGAPLASGRRGAAAPGVDPRQLRGDVQCLLARALAPELDRRYRTAAELADDVERCLGGRPLAAHPPSLGYRFGKLVRRHRAAALAVAVAASSLLVATAVSVREARLAEIQRARAERRFADVRRLANVVLFDVHDALENVAGAMAARRLLVDTALRYLDDLAREAGDDAALLGELAVAYERIGEIQGMPGWPSEGRTGDALASLERALALARRSHALAGSSPAGTTAAAAPASLEARVLARIGSVLAARGDTAAALERHRAARDLLARQLAAAPSTAGRLELAQAQVAVGDDVWELGDITGAAAHYGAALATSRQAVARDAASTLARRQVGVVEQRLGDAAAELGAWGSAAAHHAASLTVDRQLAAQLPEDVEIRRDLGTDLSRLGVDQARRGDAAAALALHREASRLREALLAGEPRDARAAEDAAESLLEAGKALAALGHGGEAVQQMSTAIARWRELLRRDAHNVRWSDELASALATRADVETKLGDPASASASLAEALAIRRRLLAESPDFASNRASLAMLEQRMQGVPRARR